MGIQIEKFVLVLLLGACALLAVAMIGTALLGA